MTTIINPNQDCFTHCPSCGQAGLKPASNKSFICNNCNFSFYLNCAAAAMAIILDDQDRLLVTIRKKDPAKGTYDLPGGFAEPSESIDQCLIREVKEELNLDVTHLSFLCSFPNTYLYKSVTYPVTDMAFLCRVKSFNGIAARDDIASFEFIPLSDINIDCFGLASSKQVLQYFKKIKRHQN